jgi:predicted RNA-binding Zn ribbon-like protein
LIGENGTVAELPNLTPNEVRLGKMLLVGGRACLNFCNTTEYRQREQTIEFLHSFGGLVAWSHHNDLISVEQAKALLETVSASERSDIYGRAIALREAIYAVFTAQMDKQLVSVDALELLNTEWQAAMAHRKLSVEAHETQLVWQDPLTPDRILWALALSAVEVLTQDNLQWVRQCPNCSWLFLDESRKHNRTWCNMQFCGNRMKARRHYQRQKQQSGEPENEE